MRADFGRSLVVIMVAGACCQCGDGSADISVEDYPAKVASGFCRAFSLCCEPAGYAFDLSV